MSRVSIVTVLFLAGAPALAAPPVLSISDAAVYEPAPGEARTATFTVRVSGSTATAFSLRYWTVDGTATQPNDYAETTGVIVFAQTRVADDEVTISVPVFHDGEREPVETFELRLAWAGQSAAAAVGTGRIRPAARGDISGDGRSDILILEVQEHSCPQEAPAGAPLVPLNHTNREIDTWVEPMDPETQAFPVSPSPLSPWLLSAEWKVVATGDFDGDGVPDLFWEQWRDAHTPELHPHRQVTLTRTPAERIYQAPPAGDPGTAPPSDAWVVVGSGDFVGVRTAEQPMLRPDGLADLLWYDRTNGDLQIWASDGAGFPESGWYFLEGAADWIPVAVADLNGNGAPEILWERAGPEPRRLMLWEMAGLEHVASTVDTGGLDPQWTIVGAGDFNGDGLDDLLWRHADTEELLIWLMNGGTRIHSGPVTPPRAGQQPSTRCVWWEISGPR